MVTMKDLDRRLKKVEEATNKLNKKKEDKFTDGQAGWFILFILTIPVVMVGYVIAGIVLAVIKPFAYLYLTKEQSEYYHLGGSFNECEYMWSSITRRDKRSTEN